ncbi:GHMP kinase [Phycisphaerae bacterium]|jgi:D-glycero-alpha-D-manno-heptose-7-phosphate kinase|nr:GHMP kinase [Phycisphaerae bacterium]
MIISQTPYRVSFAGGGTDLPAFYRQEAGAVLSVAITKHMYVALSKRFEPSVRVAYSKTEIADNRDEVQHTIVKAALKMVDLGPHMEIVTIGDVPAGTGMGSSSTLTVGLLNALYAMKGHVTSPKKLAEEASRIEIDILGSPIGKQDQYAAAFGGLNYIRFNSDDSVDVQPVPTAAETLKELEKRALILYTEKKRDANDILKKQSEGTGEKMRLLREMRDLASEMRGVISGRGNLDEFSRLLHVGWELKRSMGFGISDPVIDEMYDAARKAGAQGGKLLGAGGGGFVFLLAPPEKHDAIRTAVGQPRELKFEVDRLGSRIIFIS